MKNEFGGIWVGEKDLMRDQTFMKEAQNEVLNESLIETLAQDNVVEDLGGNRRDFLKMLGFGLGAATVAAGCDIPVKRAIPYVIKPDEIVPGVANYYASSYVDAGDYCAILVKTREGRPIKIEGNDLSKVTYGGTSARVQAGVISLYDVNRYKSPRLEGENTTWAELDTKVKAVLSSSKGIRLVTNTVMSPTLKLAIGELQAKYNNVEVVSYDPISCAAILEANSQSFGDRVIPNYKFEKADVIVSFNADFLGTWISPIEYAHQYSTNRKIKNAKGAKMSKHVQVEGHMSMTGSNADNRILVKPSEQGAAIAFLYQQVTGGAIRVPVLNDAAKKALTELATQLKSKRGQSLIISASNNVAEQLLVNGINAALGNYGSTLDFANASLQRQGDERSLASLVSDIKKGTVDTLIFHKCNPLYDASSIEGLTEAIEGVSNKIALSYAPDETSSICNILAPIHHSLESWGDAEPKRGMVSLMQPAISPLFDTRQEGQSILTWAESGSLSQSSDQPYYDYLKKSWSDHYFTHQSSFLSFQSFWDKVLHDGVFEYNHAVNASDFNADALTGVNVTAPATSDIEIQFIEPISVGNGQYANNPWLQEMPDPVTRCAWGNYLAIPVAFDGNKKFEALNGLNDGDLVDIKIGEATFRVPVIQQFGQMPGTVALALGYGREVVGFAGNGIGVNVNASVAMVDGLAQYRAAEVSVSSKKGKEEHYSAVQYHHTMGVTAPDNQTGEIINADETALAPGYGNIAKGFQGALVERSIIRKAHIDHLDEAIENLHHEREHFEELNQKTLYPYEKYSKEMYSQGHHWGMHVDLNACTGCGACTVACMAENNIPVVGKKQVSRHQEMAWLRIDRYYYGDVNNPNVVYQPMMCQHCDNAPCENVCPVNATNHSSEGLNQMTYNRCIGTRYCANNCPFKVRRFNWLDYTTADLFPANQVDVNHEDLPFGADNLTRMVLNPDVTVRTRGVIEKCSFCVQRIQEGKLTSKKEGRALQDSDVRTACQTSCPTGAITFGDMNNPHGELFEKFESPLNMIVLEEVNTRPSVQYTMKVNNRDEALEV